MLEAVATVVDRLDLVAHCAVKVMTGPVLDADPDPFLAGEAAGDPSSRNIAHGDYTGLVASLAGPEASMVQGQVIFANGGQYIVA